MLKVTAEPGSDFDPLKWLIDILFHHRLSLFRTFIPKEMYLSSLQQSDTAWNVEGLIRTLGTPEITNDIIYEYSWGKYQLITSKNQPGIVVAVGTPPNALKNTPVKLTATKKLLGEPKTVRAQNKFTYLWKCKETSSEITISTLDGNGDHPLLKRGQYCNKEFCHKFDLSSYNAVKSPMISSASS